MSRFIQLLVFVFLLSSCATIVNYEQTTVTEITDYTPLTEKGIFVTEANNVNFDYTPLGSVVSTTRGAIQNLMPYKVDMEKAFNSIAEELLKKGANGLINLNINTTYLSSAAYTTITGMAIQIKNPELKPEKHRKVVDNTSSECVIDGIKALVIQRRPSGIFISTDKKMTPVQIAQLVEKLQLANKAVQVFLANGGDKAYAGVTDNGYYINYETKEFIELSQISSGN